MLAIVSVEALRSLALVLASPRYCCPWYRHGYQIQPGHQPHCAADNLLSRRVRRRAASLKRLASATDLRVPEESASTIGAGSAYQSSDWLSQGSSSSDESDGGIVMQPAAQTPPVARV